jgi:hypothetical protein
VPLWTLICAALLPDLANALWNLTPIGDPHDLLSHSIPAVLALAAGACVLYALLRRDWRGGSLLGGLVISHLLADYVTSREAVWAGGPTIGAHLYVHHEWDLALEGAVILFGWTLYRKSLPESPPRPSPPPSPQRVVWAQYAMLAVLLGFQYVFTRLPIT